MRFTSNEQLTPDIFHSFAACAWCTVLFFSHFFLLFFFLQREQPLFSPSQRMCCLLLSFSRKHPGCCHPSTRKIQVGHFEHSRACVWKHRDLSRILFPPLSLIYSLLQLRIRTPPFWNTNKGFRQFTKTSFCTLAMTTFLTRK